MAGRRQSQGRAGSTAAGRASPAARTARRRQNGMQIKKEVKPTSSCALPGCHMTALCELCDANAQRLIRLLRCASHPWAFGARAASSQSEALGMRIPRRWMQQHLSSRVMFSRERIVWYGPASARRRNRELGAAELPGRLDCRASTFPGRFRLRTGGKKDSNCGTLQHLSQQPC